MHPSWKSPSERTIREPPTFRLPNRLIMCRTSASKRKNRMDSLPKFFTPRRVPPFVKRFRSRWSLMKRLAKIRFFPAFKRIHLTGLRNSAQYEKIAERPGSKIFVADGVGGEAFRPQKKPAENPSGGHRPCLLRLNGRRENRGGRAAELRGNSTAGPVHGVSGAGHSHRTPAIRGNLSPSKRVLSRLVPRPHMPDTAAEELNPATITACAREPPAPSTAIEAPVPF